MHPLPCSSVCKLPHHHSHTIFVYTDASGVCNKLAKYMPAEFAVHTTGHDCRIQSAYFEYIDANRALSIVGATVLAGWRAFPYGRTGKGPVPASWEPILGLGIEEDSIEGFITDVFRLDNACPPPVRPRGKLWQAVQAAAATMVMWYPQRCDAGELRRVRLAMTESLSKTIPIACEGSQPHNILLIWASHISMKWKQDNLHLTCSADNDAQTQMNIVVSEIGKTVANLQTLVVGLQRQLTSLRKSATPARLDTDTPQPTAAADTVDTTQHASAPPAVAPSAGRPFSSGGNPSDGHSAVPPAALTQLLQPTRGVEHASAGHESLAGFTAASLYLEYTALSRNMPLILKKQDQDRARVAVHWFDTFATNEEVDLLIDRHQADTGIKRLCAQKLNKLCVARLLQGYKEAKALDASIKIPNLKGCDLAVGAFQNRIRDLEKKNVKIDVQRIAFAAFRRQYEVDKDTAVTAKRRREA